MNKLSKYKSIVFDCDGVVLDSNQVKTQAFYNAAQSFGNEAAQMLVEYHMKNGGISRYKKFNYFMSTIIGKGTDGDTLEALLALFAKEVKKGLLHCKVASGLEILRKQTKQANWMIVSGGDQDELRDVFSERDLAKLFDGGIFGSPDNKHIILEREIRCENIQLPALFVGDSKYDYEAANRAGLDFVFLTELSEVKDWDAFFENKIVTIEKDIMSLVYKDEVEE